MTINSFPPNHNNPTRSKAAALIVLFMLATFTPVFAQNLAQEGESQEDQSRTHQERMSPPSQAASVEKRASVAKAPQPDDERSEPEKLTKFFEQLTYPQTEWHADDFGQLPSVNQQELLKKFQPELYVAKDSCGPMDFYGHYVQLLRSKSENESWNGIVGSRKSLKRFERNFRVGWELENPPACVEADKPPLYATTWTENMNLATGVETITILRYSFVFYQSGLPKAKSLANSFSWFLGDLERWHYLDIHGAIFYLLGANGKPFAVVLAQHNHFRTYVIGVDIPVEKYRQICFSIRSNEPYFCDNRVQVQPVAPTFKDIRYVISAKDAPFISGQDVIPALPQSKKVNYHLEFLTTKDPLKSSWRSLGPNIPIWGIYRTFYRDSPPGMDIFNVPSLKEIHKTAAYFYFAKDDEAAFELHKKNSQDFFNTNVEPVLNINRVRFLRAVEKARGRN